MLRGSFNIISFFIGVFALLVAALTQAVKLGEVTGVVVLVIGLCFALSPRMINEWERGILLRLGRFKRCLKPGVSWVIPGFDAIPAVVDMRIRSTPFTAEKTLTRDTVPVNVDAVLFWVVTDAEKAILEVEGYRETISWVAQTTLRDVIGKAELVRMISDRQTIDEELQRIIDAKTSEWGITVQSVEIRDVRIPSGLEDAMSRKAQADREKEARIILAESELKVADQMKIASEVYAHNKVALQLRAMNMTYESIKEKGALMVVPSNLAQTLDIGSTMGMAAASFELGQE